MFVTLHKVQDDIKGEEPIHKLVEYDPVWLGGLGEWNVEHVGEAGVSDGYQDYDVKNCFLFIILAYNNSFEPRALLFFLFMKSTGLVLLILSLSRVLFVLRKIKHFRGSPDTEMGTLSLLFSFQVDPLLLFLQLITAQGRVVFQDLTQMWVILFHWEKVIKL